MRFCQDHWGKLKAALTARGLMHLVATSGEEAANRLVAEATGKATDMTYDPLMSAHWNIACRALELGGLYLLSPKEDGTEYCPVCEALAHYTRLEGDRLPEPYKTVESFWIDGPADLELQVCKEKGLIPTPGIPEINGQGIHGSGTSGTA